MPDSLYPLLDATSGAILLVLPWAILAWAALDGGRGAERTALSAALGLGAVVVLGENTYRFDAARWFHFLEVPVWPAALFLLFLKKKPFLRPLLSSAGKRLFLIALLVFVLRFLPLLATDLPIGVDPTFHVLVASKIAEAGRIAGDLSPYEPILLNYPTGSHLLVALVSGDGPVHVAFKALFPLLAALTVLVLYALARRLTPRPRAALWTAVAYGFLADWGSLDLVRWGGLPTALSQLFLAAFVLLYSSVDPGKKRWSSGGWIRRSFFGALLLAALATSHHHSAVAAGAVGTLLFVQTLRAEKFSPRARFLLLSSLLAALVDAPFLLRMLPRIGRLGATGAGDILEPAVLPWEAGLLLGPALVAGALLGRPTLRRASSSGGDSIAAARAVLAWTLALGAAFVFLDYGVRGVSRLLTGNSPAVLTPSRFLSDLALPLSIMAGPGIERFVRLVGERPGRLAAALACAVQCAASLAPQAHPALGEETRAAARFIRENSPEDVLILNNPQWLPYLTGREGTNTFLPLSEEVRRPYVVEKRALVGGGAKAVAAWQKKYGRPVWLFIGKKMRSPALALLFREGETRVYKVAPPEG